jgi:fatty acid desaturase
MTIDLSTDLELVGAPSRRPSDLDVALTGMAEQTGGTFPDLLARLRVEGLLNPRYGYYALKTLSNLALMAGAWYLFVRVGNSWWTLAVAVLLAFSNTQTGFLGHDVGHRQVIRRSRWQDALGYFHGDLLLGFSYSWWVNHHNKHHGHPNHLKRDSDIVRRRVIFLPEQGFERPGRAKQFIVRHQHLLFFPLLTTEAIGLRVASFKAVRNGELKNRWLEATLIAIHLATYVTVLFMFLSPAKAVCFLLVNQLLFGLYIGSVFAPNHKGMPIERPGDNWDWLTRQVRTSRNIRSSYLTDFLFGGLNYQIEHHLFPGLARPNLRRARIITMQFCQEQGITYHEVSCYRSYAEVIAHLRRTSQDYQAEAEIRAFELIS